MLCGYATTLPHLMLATLFCERFALRPGLRARHAGRRRHRRCHADAGRANWCAAGAAATCWWWRARTALSGQSRDSAIQTLAQVGDADYEVPNGASVPAYYGLLASRYLHETGTTEADLAEFAVLMRANAARHPGAHLRTPITVAEVLASKPIAAPLKLLDCCPISDGAMALVVSARPSATGRASRSPRRRPGASATST